MPQCYWIRTTWPCKWEHRTLCLSPPKALKIKSKSFLSAGRLLYLHLTSLHSSPLLSICYAHFLSLSLKLSLKPQVFPCRRVFAHNVSFAWNGRAPQLACLSSHKSSSSQINDHVLGYPSLRSKLSSHLYPLIGLCTLISQHVSKFEMNRIFLWLFSTYRLH